MSLRLAQLAATLSDADQNGNVAAIEEFLRECRRAWYTANPDDCPCITTDRLHPDQLNHPDEYVQKRVKLSHAAAAARDSFSNMTHEQKERFAPHPLRNTATIEQQITTIAAAIPAEYAKSSLALRLSRYDRIAGLTPPLIEDSFFSAFLGEYDWLNIRPLKARHGVDAEDLPTFTARFLDTMDICSGHTDCTRLTIMKRYLAGLDCLNEMLGRWVRSKVMEGADDGKTLDNARLLAVDGSASSASSPPPCRCPPPSLHPSASASPATRPLVSRQSPASSSSSARSSSTGRSAQCATSTTPTTAPSCSLASTTPTGLLLVISTCTTCTR
jgi:hypothetical protein